MVKPMSDKAICPVCGKTEFKSEYDYDICKYCGWENDGCFDEGGANALSFAEYKKRYEFYIYLDSQYTWKSNGYPEVTKKDLCTYLHQYSVSNKKNVLSSDKCGCFFCNKIFDSGLVFAYVKDKNEETAICPFCGVDSVLPDNRVGLSFELLEDMYSIWF